MGVWVGGSMIGWLVGWFGGEWVSGGEHWCVMGGWGYGGGGGREGKK